MKTIRVPTREDYEAFAGGFCFNLWRGLGEEWKCPACGRTKFELLRWTRHVTYGDRSAGKYEIGWFAALHTHHDHSPFGTPARFNEVVICDQCNLVDGRVKRHLGLPADWSYSPDEIRRFITAAPHGNHVVDYVEARRIHDEHDVVS